MRTCKITVQVIIPLCGSENLRWPTKQILAFGTDCLSASVSVVFEGPAESDSCKQRLILSLGPGILQFALAGMGCVYTFKQIVGAAPSALSQLILLQRRIYLFFSFVQTRGQRTWQLLANHWSRPNEKQRNPLPTVALAVAPKEAHKYAPSR